LKRVQGKSFAKGGEVELTDLRGSAGAEQMSMNVWALERDQQGDNKDITRIRVLKNRLLGFTGLCDTLLYKHDTGRLVALPTEY
jgi:twinkle protein